MENEPEVRRKVVYEERARDPERQNTPMLIVIVIIAIAIVAFIFMQVR